MELTKKQEQIISVLIKLIIVTAIFFPIRDQYAKRSMYYTTFALPTFLSLCLVVYLGTVNTVRREKSRFMSVFIVFLLLYIGADLAINFLYHHYYWELFHKATAFMLLPFLWYKLPEDFFERKKIISFLLTVIVISCILSIVAYYMGIDQIKFVKGELVPKIVRHWEGNYFEKRLTFTFSHKSEYGLFLILFTSLCLRFEKNFVKPLLCYGAVGVLLYATYLTNSIATLVCEGIVAIGYVLSRLPWKKMIQKNKFLLVLIGAVFCGVFACGIYYIETKRDLASMGYRFPIWRASIEAIIQNPNGIGMNFEKISIFGEVNNCHNVFLVEVLRYSMPVGILFLVLFLLIFLKTFWKYSIFSISAWIGILSMLCIDYSLKEFNMSMLILCLFLLFFTTENR